MSLTVKQAAQKVQCHENTIRKEIMRGNLEAWKLGGDLRIEESAFEAWKKSKKVSPGPSKRRRVSGLRAIEGGG